MKANGSAGVFQFPGTNLMVNRMGYGAMQLAGPGVFGPPKDREVAKSVLREAIDCGINHIDTSDFYGPHVTNQIIKEALHPYAKDLVIVSKLGAKRGADASWNKARSREDLIAGLQDNLRNLQRDSIDIVNLRLGEPFNTTDESVEEPLKVMVELKKQGLVKHIGLSNITRKQFDEASKITEIVCVQNLYNLAKRGDDDFIDYLESKGIAYVPFFPLGGFEPLESQALDQIAAKLNATPMQVALAWLLQRSSNMLLIPGTGSLAHLRENIAAADLELSQEVLAELDSIGKVSA